MTTSESCHGDQYFVYSNIEMFFLSCELKEGCLLSKINDYTEDANKKINDCNLLR